MESGTQLGKNIFGNTWQSCRPYTLQVWFLNPMFGFILRPSLLTTLERERERDGERVLKYCIWPFDLWPSFSTCWPCLVPRMSLTTYPLNLANAWYSSMTVMQPFWIKYTLKTNFKNLVNYSPSPKALIGVTTLPIIPIIRALLKVYKVKDHLRLLNEILFVFLWCPSNLACHLDPQENGSFKGMQQIRIRNNFTMNLSSDLLKILS